MAEVICLNLHQYGFLLVASDVIFIYEVYVLLAVFIQGDSISILFNTGLYLCKDSVNFFPRIILIVVWIHKVLPPRI